ncbi:hypothetical protein REPUB_Repub16aG0096900 [Reevesia pubescens]
MDLQDVIMAMEVVLERERQKERLMEESLRAQQVALQEKVRERSMLTKSKQSILATEAAKEELVDNFMIFIGAIENNDLEIAQNFDEKAMMNTIETMMSSDDSKNGKFDGTYGDNIPQIALDLEEKGTAENNVGSCAGENGGFTSDYEGINDDPENDAGAIDGKNGDGGEDSDAYDKCSDSFSCGHRK